MISVATQSQADLRHDDAIYRGDQTRGVEEGPITNSPSRRLKGVGNSTEDVKATPTMMVDTMGLAGLDEDMRLSWGGDSKRRKERRVWGR